VLKLSLDTETGTVVDHSGRLMIVDSDALTPHATVAAKLASYRARYPETDQVVGRNARRIVRRYNEESDMGNLFADILRNWAASDVAFVHSGGLRADLPAGEVTREALLDAFPFTDLVVVLEMTGAQMLDVLEQSFSLERGVLQVSGMVARFDLDRPVGQRVVSVEIGGRPLEASATYTVGTFDFLASGADLYSGFLEGRVVVDDGPEFAELLVQRFSVDEAVEPPPRGRLIAVN
jgi:2',3'-cyclic-nucleotide 2'-phosphodiesterase (5'-nucleotidase family)